MRRPLVASFALVAVCSCSASAGIGETRRDSTPAAPAIAATAPRGPIVVTGAGNSKSDPIHIPAGSYSIVSDFGSCPIAGGYLMLVSAPDSLQGAIDIGTAPSPAHTNAYGVAAADYFANVYSCPENWTITLTPR